MPMHKHRKRFQGSLSSDVLLLGGSHGHREPNPCCSLVFVYLTAYILVLFPRCQLRGPGLISQALKPRVKEPTPLSHKAHSPLQGWHIHFPSCFLLPLIHFAFQRPVGLPVSLCTPLETPALQVGFFFPCKYAKRGWH